MKPTTRFLKRTLDITSSTTALIILLPAWVAVAVAILIGEGKPILYRQQRIGRNGVPFRLLKFRTMARGADAHSRLTPATDSRITRLGHFLRKSNLDEIPQLLNVLRGQMSIVGPRPEVPEFVDLDDERWQRTLSVRPGLTYPGTLYFRRQGQILGRHQDYVQYYRDEVLPVKLQFAERYVEDATFWGDMSVILATVVDILRPGKHSAIELPDENEHDEA